ncbi:MAG: HAD-IG family 5'-nucleotidase [Oligoflexia bacterium]|nr:HAD-IG family 5'-nucleotidase [Oligoflexia bacterium]
MSIYVNRTLNLKQISIIGFDMDYTLVRYKSEVFEEMTFREMIRKLINDKNYPQEIEQFQFDFQRIIRGLVFDKSRGNLLKLCRYRKVRSCYHGSHLLSFQEMQKIYKGLVIDLNDKNYSAIDTTFSVSSALLFSLIVDYVDAKYPTPLPSYEAIYNDINDVLDRSHMDGSLKDEVVKNPQKFVIQDPYIPEALEKLKAGQKRLIIVTNSDYRYTKALLDYTFNPFLKAHQDWSTLFDLTITGSEKPRFFTERRRFLCVDPSSGLMKNWDKPLEQGIYQGGNADAITRHYGVSGDQILYLGDHIYGDILTLKKSCNWRTGLIIEELNDEVILQQQGASTLQKIEELMRQKEALELILFQSEQETVESRRVYGEIRTIDSEVSNHITKYQSLFNPYWGPIMRAGQEESRLTGQVQKYACIYMGKVSDLNSYSPRHYFRPKRRPLPHEQF